ncbi:hypothetical protein PALB_11670 [Pseudoalteromonas luteoviolacea B = ATCC 29581]|nr:hypothetical protein PALB_11670 [Pseudoalteromonas luteoviolacea B = ATCC 29581]
MIAVDSAKLERCSIGRKNRFIGPMSVSILEGATIDKNNFFECGWWITEPSQQSERYTRTLSLGKRTLVTSEHYFDVVGTITLGDDSWIAGVGSQFWTHGAGSPKSSIHIGEQCYIGSAVRFSPGTAIGDRCLVAMGSVVTKAFSQSHCVISGVPASIKKEQYDWKTQQTHGE